MPTRPIALAAGDGIGPEIMDAALEVFRAAGVDRSIEFIPVEMGRSVFEEGNTRGMTDACIRTVEECGILFKGPMETPKGGGGKSINVTARKVWNAFANLRHFRTLPGVETPYSRSGINVNFYIVRENLEDTYGGVEHRLSNDVIQCKRLISAPGSEQVSRFAFQAARRLGLDRVHCGHKANIMKMTDGLFLDRFRAVARDFPEIEHGDVIVDALCMNLVMRPQEYRMVVLPNLQGDIVSDLAAGLVGGLGFAPSANIGRHISIFEAVHGTAPDIAGRGVANPTALLLSGIMMLRHLGLHDDAATIENALLTALEDGVRTGDFGDRERPSLGTRDYARAIADRLGSRPRSVPPVTVPQPQAGTPGAAAPEPPQRPRHQEVIRTFENVVAQVVGCDIYLDTPLSTIALAEEMTRLSTDTPFRLTLISNRGTQVWPTGSTYTECVDYWRVRFELRDGVVAGSFGQARAIALLERIAEKFVVCSYELLRTFDGIRGYSMAQGQ
ncbi:MAG TPA: isocitrate/isopropylmalate family dehydrogenase [Phycisphaerales bacterium]|nr:isocitrate/isopropylmalate family dehydrogenase [Phycisphaerales bacterium]HMP36817.1 isocitrate/isopropylmalate family dehydrogenase [Phycisphaerales bacterium]